MKFKLLFFAILTFFIAVPVSYASGYYYVQDDGKYMLCNNYSDCYTVERNQAGVTFNLASEEIIANGNNYYYDDFRQEEYYKTLYGKTRMFFYQNASGNYVLCKTENSCQTYTFDQLTEMGAVITNKSQIDMRNGDGPGVPGDIYYYSSEKESNPPSGNGNSGGNNNGNIFGSSSDYCGKLKEPLKFIGHIVVVVKILIPLIIIAFGMIDFFKAVTGSKDDEIKKSLRSLVFRCIAGVVIFLLPTLVSVVFSMIDSFVDIKGEFNACQKCVLNVKECK